MKDINFSDLFKDFYFSDLYKLKNYITSQQKKAYVNKLQKDLYDFLTVNLSDFKWVIEYKPNDNFKDSIDIFGYDEYNTKIVIELDPHRADSISKKFVSRMALLKDDNIYYVAFIYPGTENMQKNEALKYLRYCSTIANTMSRTNAEKRFAYYFI